MLIVENILSHLRCTAERFFAVDSYSSLCYNVCGIKSHSTPFVGAPVSRRCPFFC